MGYPCSSHPSHVVALAVRRQIATTQVLRDAEDIEVLRFRGQAKWGS